jgi:predicted ribosomally synthesized peptide with SipW-like signal peptide
MQSSSKGIFFTYILILLGAFVIGGATVAWFTGDAENTNNNFQSGTLKIKLDREQGNYYFDIHNIAPGDQGRQAIVISNTGSLDLVYQVSYTITGVLAEGEHPLECQLLNSSDERIDLDLERRLASGQQEPVTITWKMPEEAGNEYQGGTARFDLVVSATQVKDHSNGSSSHYVFRNLSPDDFINMGSWSIDNQGFITNFGLMFIPNKQASYRIIANTVLHEGLYSNGTSGGYGLFFETNLLSNNQDTGYILQFDRGYGAITIRRRVNGREASPIIKVSHQDFPLIPEDKLDPWWTENHRIEIQVNNGIEGCDEKSIRVLIDRQPIIENLIIESGQSEESFTGLRTWHATSTFIDLSIQ